MSIAPRTLIALTAALVAAGGLIAGCDAARVPRVAVGEPAPAYSAVTLDGNPIALEDLRGRVVLLNLWATWCFPCREEIPVLQALHEQLATEGLEVVGVSIDVGGTQPQIREFADEFGVTYPIWHDPDARITNTFLAVGVPTTFLIDREGIIRWRHLGPVRADDPTLQAALADAGLAPGGTAAR